jgi:hypothetical protein
MILVVKSITSNLLDSGSSELEILVFILAWIYTPQNHPSGYFTFGTVSNSELKPRSLVRVIKQAVLTRPDHPERSRIEDSESFANAERGV